MYITLTGVILVIDIVVSCIAALIGKYDAASYYVLLGILFIILTILFTSSDTSDTEEHYVSNDTERNDDTND